MSSFSGFSIKPAQIWEGCVARDYKKLPEDREYQVNEKGDLSLKPRGAPIRLGYKLLGQTLCPPEKQGKKESGRGEGGYFAGAGAGTGVGVGTACVIGLTASFTAPLTWLLTVSPLECTASEMVAAGLFSTTAAGFFSSGFVGITFPRSDGVPPAG